MPRPKPQNQRRRNSQFQTSAVLELVFASVLWGFGFIATAWALRAMGPLTLTGLRMFLAFGFGILICTAVPSLRRQLGWDQFKLAFWPGLFLCATMLLQTWGLKYTTVTKSGFITTLYVLIVPLLERLILGRRIPKYHMLYVLAALLGVALICDLPQLFRTKALAGLDPRTVWNFGDWLTLACAIAASFQIVWFGRIQTEIRSSFVFNVFQTFWTGLIPFCLMFVFESLPAYQSQECWNLLLVRR
jgi:drug/metabolite transporter (DMT)-like permease